MLPDAEIELGNGTDAKGLPLPGWVLDPRSTASTRKFKPLWFFQLPNKAGQAAARRELGRVYKTAADLNWEEKWSQVEANLRLSRSDLFAASDHDNSRIERITNPDIFAGCNSEEERKAALLGQNNPAGASTQTNPSSTAKIHDTKTDEDAVHYDEAGIWQMVVAACEQASEIGEMNVRPPKL